MKITKSGMVQLLKSKSYSDWVGLIDKSESLSDIIGVMSSISFILVELPDYLTGEQIAAILCYCSDKLIYLGYDPDFA